VNVFSLTVKFPSAVYTVAHYGMIECTLGHQV